MYERHSVNIFKKNQSIFSILLWCSNMSVDRGVLGNFSAGFSIVSCLPEVIVYLFHICDQL